MFTVPDGLIKMSPYLANAYNVHAHVDKWYRLKLSLRLKVTLKMSFELSSFCSVRSHLCHSLKALFMRNHARN